MAEIVASQNVKTIETSQNAKTIETGTLSIRGHLVRWGDTVIQIGNISAVTVGTVATPQSPNGMTNALLGLVADIAGLVFIFQGLTKEDMGTFLVGLVIGIIGIAFMLPAMLSSMRTNTTKTLNLHLNSGNVFSIAFKYESFMNDVLSVFSQIFEDGTNHKDGAFPAITFNIEKNEVYGAMVNKENGQINAIPLHINALKDALLTSDGEVYIRLGKEIVM